MALVYTACAANRQITMAANYESFKQELSLSKAEICRELFRENAGLIRIKKEHVAVGNLVRIIDSTLRLANANGFHAMSLRDLSADSGMSLGGLYAYIRNKDDLLHLIQRHGFKLTHRTLLQVTEPVADPRDKLLAAIRTHLYLSELMRAWFYFSYMEAKNLPEKEKREAIEAEVDIESIFCDIIEAGIQAGTFRAVNARLTASILKAMLQDWYLKRGKYRRQEVSVEAYAGMLGEMMDRHLSADPGPAPSR